MIRKEITVGAPPDKAFRVWHQHIQLWWPPSHHTSSHPSSTLVFEPRVDGRIFERSADRGEVDYGRVVAFEAPDRLAYTFFMGTGRDRPTLVEVTFEACAGGTRVVVQHHAHLAADDFERTAPRFHAGWGLLLPAFADHLLTSESP